MADDGLRPLPEYEPPARDRHARAIQEQETPMNMWYKAFDEMNSINPDELTVDQRLKLAEVKALLSISQELSKIHHEGINPEYDPGD